MKFSCDGCKYEPYDENNKSCTECGRYVLSEDGESTDYAYVHWTPKEEKCICEKVTNMHEELISQNCCTMLLMGKDEKGYYIIAADNSEEANVYTYIDFCPYCGRKLK